MHKLFFKLVKHQKKKIAAGLKLLVIVRGRDAAGKDGTIKLIIKHLNFQKTKGRTFDKPSDIKNAKSTFDSKQVLQEAKIFFPNIQSLSISNNKFYYRNDST